MSDSPRSVLADVVRLWACAPTGATPAAGKELALPPGWVQALGRTPVFARSTLSLPRGEISLQVITPPPPEPPQPPKPQGRAPLQASPLVVVSADLQSAEQSQQRIEEQGRQPDLKPEDYGPLVQGREPRLPLAPKSRWWPALRQFAPRKAGGLDLPRLVALLAQAKPLKQLPVLQRRGQFRELCVLRDKRKAMVPFDADFDELLGYLRAQPQAARLTVRLCDGLPSAIPATADAVLVLSDLGWSEPDAGQWPHQRWQDWAWRLTQKGVAVQAWVPVAAQMLPSSLVRRLDCVPWHAHSRFKPVRPGQAAAHPMHKWAQAAQAKAQLWPRLAVAQRVEPALLRRARLASGGAGQPQWESLLWRDDADLAAGFVALQTRPNAVAAWRAVFAALPCAAQLQVWHMLQAQHAHLPRSTLVVERLVWHSHACEEARHQVAEEVNQAQAWLQRMAAQEARNTQAHGLDLSQAHALHTGFLQSLVSRNADDARFTAAHQHNYAALAVAAGMVGQGRGVGVEAWVQAAGAVSAEDQGLPWRLALQGNQRVEWLERIYLPILDRHQPSFKASRTILLQAKRGKLLWQPDHQQLRQMGRIETAEAGTLCFTDALGTHRLVLAPLHRPKWASALATDTYGIFAEINAIGPALRLRYLPPATFFMGSPEGEGAGDEHPQHPVTLTQGLWLAETPCTQALWQAVMGQNPSHFNKGPEAPQRPVESVSWDEVQQFLVKFNALLPERCKVVLPTEAQWEYACRAGTQTAYWWGDAPDDIKANFIRIGETNWDAEDGSTPVDLYPPNPWGLRDMHGNVDEWCADALRTYEEGAVRDPMGDTGGDFRVVRGGSWFAHTGEARSSYRRRELREMRSRTVGFRIAIKPLNYEGDGVHFSERPSPDPIAVEFDLDSAPELDVDKVASRSDPLNLHTAQVTQVNSANARDSLLQARMKVEKLRHLVVAKSSRVRYSSELGSALRSLATVLSTEGNYEAALQAAQQAADLYRELALQRPDAHAPDWAASLSDLANLLSAVGQHEAALQAAQQTADLYRQLALQRSDAHTPGWAGSLNNLANMLCDVGQPEAALQTAQQAADLYRELARQRPDAYTPDWAMSLNNLANRLSAVGQAEAALQAARQGADLYGELARQRPDAYTPAWASSLNNLANVLCTMGDLYAALQASQQAADLYRELVWQRPDVYTPDLATSLTNLADIFSTLGQRDSAVLVAQQVADLYRELARQLPDVYTSKLAASLANLATKISS